MRTIVALALLLATGVALGEEPAPEPLAHENFFIFDNGLNRGEWSVMYQADMLIEAGAAGMGYTGFPGLPDAVDTFRARGLRIFSTYVGCNLDADPPYSPDFAAEIKDIAQTDVVLWLFVQGKDADDARAAEVVGEIADLAKAADLRVALYPHHGFYIADLDDAMRVTELAERDNLGVTFNLCHELRAGNEARFDEILEAAAPELYMVSINGADHEGGWDKLIQPLGQGEFDVSTVLRKLVALDYRGPIGLQCYAVPGDPKENVAASMAAWKKMTAEIEGE